MIARVIVDIALSEIDKIFDYSVPETMDISVGQRVLLPFGKRTITGYVIALTNTSDVDSSKLKPIISKLDVEPIITADLMALAHYMKNHYHLRMVDCMRLVVPSAIRSGKVKELVVTKCSLDMDAFARLSSSIRANAKNQIGLINYLKEHGTTESTKLNKMFGSPTLNKLVNMGIVILETASKRRLNYSENLVDNGIVLNDTQKKVIDTVLTTNEQQTYLLHGVTGSGKTEVYMNIIKTVLARGKSAIMLVPEISLTPQVVRNFNEKFGNNIAVLHSGLSLGERYDEWYKIFSGDAKVVVGARSAIFAPVKNLGVVIIDEEHDSSYYSENNPRYFTHEVASFRCKYDSCPLILGSATPSIESYHKALTGQYTLLEMPKRANGKEMPPIEIVDMCKEFRSGNKTPFSATFLSDLDKVVEKGEQAMVYINRRGYSSFLMCRNCGYVPKCTDCDVSLVYHSTENELKCHYCGNRYHNINICPECESKDIKLGGVGTEQVVKLLKERYPSVKVFRMDNDTTKTKNASGNILHEFGQSKPSILVGTQMIAKGHDFPFVTLVGILDADLSLYFSDFRASEKTFQLVTQVSGRAGRSDKNGKVILQTFYPKHYVYRFVANYDYKRFFDKECNLREVTQFPPFASVVRVLVTSDTSTSGEKVTHDIFMKLKEYRAQNQDKIYFLKAMRSPLSRLKNKFRYQLILRIVPKFNEQVMSKVYDTIDDYREKNVSVFVETNAQNLS